MYSPGWADGLSDEDAKNLRRTTHSILERINRDYERIHYNTVVAGTMEILNALEKVDPNSNDDCAMACRETLEILETEQDENGHLVTAIDADQCERAWEAESPEFSDPGEIDAE